MKASTFCSSRELFSSDTGTRPAACAGATVGTGSGGVRVMAALVAVMEAVAVRVAGSVGVDAMVQAFAGDF